MCGSKLIAYTCAEVCLHVERTTFVVGGLYLWPLEGHTGTRFSGSTLYLSLLLDFDCRLLEPCILVYGSKINMHASALTH